MSPDLRSLKNSYKTSRTSPFPQRGTGLPLVIASSFKSFFFFFQYFLCHASLQQQPPHCALSARSSQKSTVCRAWLLQSRASFTGGVGLQSMGLSSTVEIWVFLFHLVLFSWAENSLPFKEAVSQMQSLL